LSDGKADGPTYLSVETVSDWAGVLISNEPPEKAKVAVCPIVRLARNHAVCIADMMAQMRCPDCPRFDKERHICLDGKINPPHFSQAVEVANVMGVRSICPFSSHRERLLSGRARRTDSQARRHPGAG